MHNVLIVGACAASAWDWRMPSCNAAHRYSPSPGDRKALPGYRHWRSGPGSACKR